MTHEYTLLLGGVVLPGEGRAPRQAIAWAEGTILALGSEQEVRAISRGDSHVLTAGGGFVVPLGPAFEIGGAADLAIYADDPRLGDAGPPRIVIRDGRVVEGGIRG